MKQILFHLPDHTESAGGYYSQSPLLIGGRLIWQDDHVAGIEPTPVIGAEDVLFNGRGEKLDNSEDLGHETFYVSRVFDTHPYLDKSIEATKDERGWYFDFCKTARKPYDLAVCAALIRLAARFPEGVEVSSDGGPEDWEEARRLVESIFGHAIIPLRQEVA